MEKFKVNKELIPVKAHYFLINGAHAGVIPFIPVYAKQMGISSGAVGIIYALVSCLTFISRPLFGGLVDHFQKLKHVLIALILIDTAADLGLSFIPRVNEKQFNNANATLLCHLNSSYVIDFDFQNCQDSIMELTNNCTMSCSMCQDYSILCTNRITNGSTNSSYRYFEAENSLAVRSIISSDFVPTNCVNRPYLNCDEECYNGFKSCDGNPPNPTLQLWLLTVFVAIIYISLASIVSLSDAACFHTLGNHPELYGKQRLWGTIGWGFFAALTGYLNQIFSGTYKHYSFAPGFYMLVVIFAIDLIFIHKLKLANVHTSKHICKDVGLLIAKPNIALFIVGVFFIGVLTGISRSYLFWYLRTLDASQLILGLAAGTQCFLGELPFFFFSGWIIRKIGHMYIFIISFIAYGFKFIAHSFLINPWWDLPIELLQGPCFGSFYAAMTSYAKIIAPQGTEATMQGIVSGAFEGLGVATGSLLGGFSLGAFGGRKTFFWCGILSMLSGIMHLVMHLVINRKNKGNKNLSVRKQQLEEQNEEL